MTYEPKDLGVPLWISLLPGAEGDDGLTRWERKWLANRAMRRRPSKESREALRKWRETKEDKK